MRTLVLARKELCRRRLAVLATLLLVNIAVLGGAAQLPRSFTAATRLDPVLPPEQKPAVAARIASWLRERPRGPGETLLTTLQGSDVLVEVSAPDASRATAALDEAIDALVEHEIGLLRDARKQAEAASAERSRTTASRLQEIDTRLKAAMRDLPAGGEAAAGARVGQLRAELDALAIALRADRQQHDTLAARLAEIGQRIDGARAAGAADAGAADDATVQSLLAEQATLAPRVAHLADELAAKRQQEKALRSLIERANEEALVLQTGGESLRALRRDYEQALALDLRATEELDAARRRAAAPLALTDLPFRTGPSPLPPVRADGVPPWIWNLVALLAGGVLVVVVFFGRTPFDGRARLPEDLVLGAELEVLAVVPDYRPRPRAGPVFGRAFAASTLLLLLAVAHAAYLLVAGGPA